MHRHAILAGVLLGACAAGDVDRALPNDDVHATIEALTSGSGFSVDRTSGPSISVERKPIQPTDHRPTTPRTPAAPQRASAAEVQKMERDIEAQRTRQIPRLTQKQLEQLLQQIVDTPKGRARARMLEEYAVYAYALDEVGRKRAIARANQVLEPKEAR